MEIGKLKIPQLSVVSILNMQIEAAMGEHARLELECVVKSEDVPRLLDEVKENKEIQLKETNTILFWGKMNEIEVHVDKEYAQVKLIVYAHTYFMDLTKNSKSYQNVAMTYQEVVATKNPCEFPTGMKAIEQIIVQYIETDWEFVKRVAAKCHVQVYSDMTAINSLLYCGVNKAQSVQQIHLLDAGIPMKNLDACMKMQGNQLSDVTMEDSLCYELRSDSFLKVGDAVSHQGATYYVTEAHYQMEQAGFEARYLVKSERATQCESTGQKDMAGAALEGKIIAVDGEKVQVHLTIDAQQSRDNAYWFPFSTLQSASDGSGWYYMPEEGDCVKVCIPSWEENGAFAVSAISTYESEDGGEDMMGDTGVKYMRNPSGNQVQLTPDAIKGDANGASMFCMGTDGRIRFEGKQSLSITAEETIELFADTDIEIGAGEVLDIVADTSGELMFNNAGEIQQLGGQVNVNSED